MGTKLTQEEFVTRSKEIHKGKYDYSKSVYNGYDNPVIITCPIHGDFKQKPHQHLNGRGCPKCGQEIIAKSRRLTKDEFIMKANKIHNNKYDYSLVEYKNNSTKIKIICPEHGIFLQTPANHLWGNGCPKCKRNSLKKPIYKKYYNDYEGSIWDNNKKKMIQSYIAWRAMIIRCENENYHKIYPTYIGCSVCEEWHKFSFFKTWFDKHYIEGWALDKDLLIKNNKIYSPQNCVFLPQEINSALTYRKSNKGECLVGVTKNRYGKYTSDYHKEYLGTSASEIEIFYKYKEAKERDFKALAEKYKEKLEERAYKRLYELTIDIND